MKLLTLSICIRTSTNSTGSIAVTSAHYSDSTLPVTVNTLDCTGYEDGLLECPMSNLSNHVCDSYEDAGIICQGWCTVGAAMELAMSVVFNNSTQLLQHCTLSVIMVIYGLWVEDHWKVDWKYASTVPGGQCAIPYSAIVMQLQLVISLDLKEMVSSDNNYTLTCHSAASAFKLQYNVAVHLWQ